MPNNWRDALANIFETQAGATEKAKAEKQQAENSASDFIKRVITPAVEELKSEFTQHGRTIDFYPRTDEFSIYIKHGNETEIGMSGHVRGDAIWMDIEHRDRKTGQRFRGGNYWSLADGGNVDPRKVTKEEIILAILNDYRREILWPHA